MCGNKHYYVQKDGHLLSYFDSYEEAKTYSKKVKGFVLEEI